MGIINTLLDEQGTHDSILSPRESFASFLLMAAGADDHFSPNELNYYCTIINRMEIFRGMTKGEFKAIIQRIVALSSDQGRSRVIEMATEGLPEELRETAFTVAADAAFADGSIDEEEVKTLEEIQSSLEIPDSQATKIIEVLKIKNRG